MGSNYVGVEVGLWPFEASILRKSGGRNGEDAEGSSWIASTLLCVFSISGVAFIYRLEDDI